MSIMKIGFSLTSIGFTVPYVNIGAVLSCGKCYALFSNGDGGIYDMVVTISSGGTQIGGLISTAHPVNVIETHHELTKPDLDQTMLEIVIKNPVSFPDSSWNKIFLRCMLNQTRIWSYNGNATIGGASANSIDIRCKLVFLPPYSQAYLIEGYERVMGFKFPA